MNLTINNQQYDLTFGLDFINHLDKKYYIDQNGFKIGQGLTYVKVQLELGNPLILIDLIVAGTIKKDMIKMEEIKYFIEHEADIEELITAFSTAIEKAPITRFTMKKLRLLEKQTIQ